MHTAELKAAINEAMEAEWTAKRGITIESVSLNPITLTPEDMKKISEMENAATMGQNPFIMAGRMTNATANAMETAASNTSGAMNGFIGMNMAGNAMGGGFNAAQNLYNMGQQQILAAQQAQKEQQVSQNGWKCSYGAISQGKFCTECGDIFDEKDVK